MPPSASRRISVRMSRMPPGSRPVAGSSRSKQLRPSQQRGRDPEPLAHAVRVPAHLVVGAPGELDRLERLLDARGGLVTVVGRHHAHVGARGHVRVEPRRLHESRDALQRRGALGDRIAAEQAHRAGRRVDQPEQHAQRGGLAGAVGPQEAVDVTAVDRQIDVVHRGDSSVLLDQPPCFDGSVTHESSPAAVSAAIWVTEPATT